MELAAANLELSLEITQRKAAEAALLKSEQHYSVLLKQSDDLQEQLRHLSRQILSAQEEERKRISRELHDVIAQTLTGINLRLATLKKEAAVNTRGLDRNIDLTQRLVEKSVNIVHEFARELRPAVLDDLGLIPALHAFVKLFSQRTRIHVHSKTLPAWKPWTSTTARSCTGWRRKPEQRVAALHARRVEVDIQRVADGVAMRVHDNGKSFQVERVLNARGRNAWACWA